MFGIVGYGAYVVSSVALCLTPGVDTVYILTRCLAGGRREGVASALGINAGLVLHTLLVSSGLSLLLAACEPAFLAVRVAGALYLSVLGIRGIASALRSDRTALSVGSGADARDPRRTFVQGVMTNLLNPKIVLFFLALLPQFVSTPNKWGMAPFLVLGLTYAALSMAWTLVLVMAATPLSRLLASSRRASTVTGVVAGLVYLALGAMVFLAS